MINWKDTEILLGGIDQQADWRNKHDSSISLMTQDYNDRVENQLLKWTHKRNARSKVFKDIDISKIFRDIDKEIAISKRLSQKEDHVKVDSLIERKVDLLPEIPVY